ncbi:ribosome 60S biogenesis N-terminal-domain-containing protein [Lyophyllum atratum]|nr:ribosome 60S biogenesis N-terminal-domain-containing protein [Lyophyllum atratum]
MSAKFVNKSGPPDGKRRKLDHGKRTHMFTSAEEISAALRTQNQEILVENLTALRNQFSIRPGEDAIAPLDARLLLAQHWLENVPGAHDMFGVWDSLTNRQNSIFALVVSVISSLLELLSSHYTFHILGQPIIKTLLTPSYSRRLNSYLGGTHAELILVTLKLFNTMSAFAGGRERKSVLESFGWELKSLPKLLNMRRKARVENVADALMKPDIRTLYMLFMLSFVASDSPSQVKATFLEQHRDPFSSIFRGLIQDAYPVIRKVLEVCWAGIWSDAKVKRTLKIGLFNETTIGHLLKLYDRAIAEGDDPDAVPADLVHHFLLAICTRPGAGICFRDRGWYPRESDGDSSDQDPGRGKIYNKILGNILKSLKVNEDPRQQELALKIMAACPELVSGYWAAAALTLEPRLSSKWIANIAFFGSVISLHVPSSFFYLPNTTLYRPAPPPLSNIIENIVPSVNTKAHLSKGLQSPSGLVQHCTAVALAKCLAKYEAFLAVFRHIETALQENEGDGQWSKTRRDVEREVRRRVPDFQVVVAFSQQKFNDPPTAPPGAHAPQPNPIRAALLAESADRLLWMYQRCLPLVVAEARFDVGKLLQNFSAETQAVKTQDASASDAAPRLHAVRQLHVLRLLKDSDQFGWSGKIGSTSQSYLAVLLKAYTVSENSATRTALSVLLQHILSESIMFQDDPTEPHLWLISLPTSQRARGTESPDGAPLTDEGDSVIAFLDECVQRCLKTPYRYIEDLQSLAHINDHVSSVDKFDVPPSPLLMTVLEQLEIKIAKKLLSSSHVLALTSFVRKLGYRLSSKQQDLTFIQAVALKFDVMLHADRLFPEFPVITAAIRREVDLLKACLFLSPHLSSSQEVSEDVQDFLSAVEQMPIPPSRAICKTTAFELLDWLRLVEDTLGPKEIRHVSSILVKLYPPSLALVPEHVVPIDGCLWNGLDLVSSFPNVRQYLEFDFLFLHASPAQIVDETCREMLTETALAHEPNIVEVTRAVCLICHRMARGGDDEMKGLFLLLASILKRSFTALIPTDYAALKKTVFVRSKVIESSLVSDSLSAAVLDGLRRLVEDTLDATNTSDRMLLADTSAHWLEALKSSLSGAPIQNSLITIWVKYLEAGDLFEILDALLMNTRMPSPARLDLLGDVLAGLRALTTSEAELEPTLIRKLPQLMALRPVLANSAVLEDLIAIAVESSVPLYYNGRRCSEALEETSLTSIVRQSELRWSRHLDSQLEDLLPQSFLTQDTWTTRTVTIITGLIYRRRLLQNEFFSWLTTSHCAARSPEHLITVIHAFLDTALAHEEEILLEGSDIWLPQFSRLLAVVSDDELAQDARSIAGASITLMIQLIPSHRSDFISSIIHAVQASPVTKLDNQLLSVGRRLHATFPLEAEPLTTELSNHGLQWGVRFFTDTGNGSFDAAVEELTSLVQSASGIKPHLVETVMGVVIQNHLAHLPGVKLITALVSNVHLKPAVVNRQLQSILQHPKFFKLCANPGPDSSVIRDAVVLLLHVLFHLHPTNTCQVTHVEPLVRIYRGTLSPADGRILSIFQLFEGERKVSTAALLSRWSSTPNFLSGNSLEAIQSLDPILVLRTCLNFPGWRRLEVLSAEKATSHEAQLYDPLFLILLFAQMLAENPPESAFGWVELFRTNIVSLLIKALSSKDGAIRDVALCQIVALWKHLETADVQERSHVLYILTLLKDVLSSSTEGPPRRLPSYTTLLLLHAARGVFYPSNFIYPITARFLLQRPGLDTNDVPMLYNMLYSSADDWKKERGWMIRFLANGMMSADDWRIFKGRHTWDLLASLFQSSEDDPTLRAGVLEVLMNLTCNTQATTSLVLKSGLLSWIEIQLLTSKHISGVEWVKILDNVMTITNPEKLELSTNGEWRALICRCLRILLDSCRSSNTSTTFPLVVQAALRLSLLPGPEVSELPLLLGLFVEGLKRLESSTTVPVTSIRISPRHQPRSPLYRAHEIHEHFQCDDTLQTWGVVVEALWRISMTLKEASDAWDAITDRMLVWRALAGADKSNLPEWVRRQVVRNMAV